MRRSNRILVSIDALLDTRLGMVLEHKPHLYKHIDMAVYNKRVSDAWLYHIGWDMEEYDVLWAKRTVDVLKQSKPTVLLMEGLWHAILERYAASKLGIEEEKPVVTINFFPYHLTEDEAVEMIECIAELYPEVELKYGRWCDKHLNPTYLRKHWDAMIVYDWYSWLGAQAKNLENRIPKFVIYRPALISHETVPEAIDGIISEKSDPFAATKDFMSEYVCLEHLSAELFSAKEI